MLYTNNSYSRTRNNEACAGAYYTDLAHASSIGELLIWPTEGVVSCLEPSIGDATAVEAATRPDINPVEIYGVELNDEVAAKTNEKEHVKVCLSADFTNGCMIRRNAFGLCFANPPYLADRDEEGISRIEIAFLERIVNYLKIDGILIWIVSYPRFMEQQHTRMWMRNFETIAAYKFRVGEYEKFHQIVFIGKKRSKREEIFSSQIESFQEKYHLSLLDELPLHPEPFIHVPAASTEVNMFTTRIFDANAAYRYLSKNGIGIEVGKAMGQRIGQIPFNEVELSRPPIPLKKDSLYLLATSGCGQGITGSEEKGDLHLQRGVAEVIEEEHYNTDEDAQWDDDSTSGTITVTTRTAITMTIVENSGKITSLT